MVFQGFPFKTQPYSITANKAYEKLLFYIYPTMDVLNKNTIIPSHSACCSKILTTAEN